MNERVRSMAMKFLLGAALCGSAAMPACAASSSWRPLLQEGAAPEDRQRRQQSTASAYALYAAPAGVVLPFDQWNKTRLVVSGMHVEHWLNGRKVVEYGLQSADWKGRVSSSKFAAYPHYGLATTGLIGIQGDPAQAESRGSTDQTVQIRYASSSDANGSVRVGTNSCAT